MAIQINGCTVIDDSRNIINTNCVRVGVVTITGSTGNIQTTGTITAGGLHLPPYANFFSPASGSTGIDPRSDIVITYNQVLSKNTGNITIRTGSASGTIVDTIPVTSENVVLAASSAGTIITVYPTIASLPYGSTIYVVFDAGAFTGVGGNTPVINTYSFSTQSLTLGQEYEDAGFLICMTGSTRWIVSPCSSEAFTNWYSRTTAATTATSQTGVPGWFVPSWAQMSNPGYACRTYWDGYQCTSYWVNDAPWVNQATYFNMGNGGSSNQHRNLGARARAFRTVTY